ALGQVLADELGDPARAAAAYARAVELAPDDATSLAALARLQRRLEDWDGAAAASDRLATLGPTAALLADAAELHVRRGDDEAAEGRFARALDLEPGHLPSLLGLAEIARRRRDWARVGQRLVEAARTPPNRPAPPLDPAVRPRDDPP